MKPKYKPGEKPNANRQFQVKQPNGGLRRGLEGIFTR
jgi:hypothetical protein